MRDRLESENIEAQRLAPYASKSVESRGRVHPDEEHPYRTAYMRDRDRVIHSAAFRRLESKTQVFVYHEGDYYRTRLTHTLEVSQISRSIARALRLNEDLCEAIALCHDLGHPPFGHAGERTLDELMKDDGGFEHNLHTLRIVDHVEHRYPEFRGLNLTWETREAIASHSRSKDHASVKEFVDYPNPSIEGQVVDLADSIAYNTHDLDDGLTHNLINEDQLKDVAVWRKARAFVESIGSMPTNIVRYQVIRRIINSQVGDVIRQTENNIQRFGVEKPDQARGLTEWVAGFSADWRRERKELREFLRSMMYRNYQVIRMEEKAHNIVTRLFKAYASRPEILPDRVHEKIDSVGKNRLICDYIAGMTDRFAIEEYGKLFDPTKRVV